MNRKLFWRGLLLVAALLTIALPASAREEAEENSVQVYGYATREVTVKFRL